jgi:hypothetical protein
MTGSPIAKSMLKAIIVWETILKKTQDNIQKWLKLQVIKDVLAVCFLI